MSLITHLSPTHPTTHTRLIYIYKVYRWNLLKDSMPYFLEKLTGAYCLRTWDHLSQFLCSPGFHYENFATGTKRWIFSAWNQTNYLKVLLYLLLPASMKCWRTSVVRTKNRVRVGFLLSPHVHSVRGVAHPSSFHRFSPRWSSGRTPIDETDWCPPDGPFGAGGIRLWKRWEERGAFEKLVSGRQRNFCLPNTHLPLRGINKRILFFFFQTKLKKSELKGNRL